MRVGALPGDLPFEEAIGVWTDLERALEGKNGYGGNVAEIYAYRLVPAHIRHLTDPPFITGATAEQERVALTTTAATAAYNLTRLLRHFVELHEGVEIAIEDGPREFRAIDPRTEDCPPFAHRVHLRVSLERQIRDQFADDLLALWRRAQDVKLPRADFSAWDGATKDLLMALGMVWIDDADGTYGFRRKP